MLLILLLSVLKKALFSAYLTFFLTISPLYASLDLICSCSPSILVTNYFSLIKSLSDPRIRVSNTVSLSSSYYSIYCYLKQVYELLIAWFRSESLKNCFVLLLLKFGVISYWSFSSSCIEKRGIFKVSWNRDGGRLISSGGRFSGCLIGLN
jgi:hypothetical protein